MILPDGPFVCESDMNLAVLFFRFLPKQDILLVPASNKAASASNFGLSVRLCAVRRRRKRVGRY